MATLGPVSAVKPSGRRPWPGFVALAGVLVVALALVVWGGSDRVIVAATIDWPGYLGGPQHDSYSPSTSITTANAASLVKRWTFHAAKATMLNQPFPSFISSPIVFQGRVFIGSNSGVFYAVDEATGHQLWSQFVGFQPKLTCPSARGVSATASAGFDPVSGLGTVYIAGGDGYVYAFDAATGTQRWRGLVALTSNTVNDYYNWASPVVANGRVYMGISSQCDKPLVRGGAVTFDQVTGALISTYYSEPVAILGGAVWSSPGAGTDGTVFLTTGTPPSSHVGDAPAVVRLDSSGNRLEAWVIPVPNQVGDSDFGGSPTMFTATIGGAQHSLVGACNKNGNLYVLDAADLSKGPIWTLKVGVGTPNGVLSCLASPAFDGTNLYLAGNETTIQGISHAGSARAVNPATGAVIWETGLNSVVLGSPAVNANHVLAAATYGNGVVDGVYLIDGATGAILTFFNTGKEFSQPVFADQYLFIASHNILGAYSP